MSSDFSTQSQLVITFGKVYHKVFFLPQIRIVIEAVLLKTP